MIRILNYIVGIAVLLVAFGIPLRIYLMKTEDRNREQMLKDIGALPDGEKTGTQFLDAERLEQNREAMRNLGTVGKSMDALNDLIPGSDLQPDSNRGSLSHSLVDLLGEGDFDDTTFQEAFRSKIDLDALTVPSGTLPENVTDKPELMDRYLKAIEENPTDYEAMYHLAVRHLEVGEIEEAESLADRIKKYDRTMAGNLRELINSIKRKK